jgi:hypothetical protein
VSLLIAMATFTSATARLIEFGDYLLSRNNGETILTVQC